MHRDPPPLLFFPLLPPPPGYLAFSRDRSSTTAMIDTFPLPVGGSCEARLWIRAIRRPGHEFDTGWPPKYLANGDR